MVQALDSTFLRSIFGLLFVVSIAFLLATGTANGAPAQVVDQPPGEIESSTSSQTTQTSTESTTDTGSSLESTLTSTTQTTTESTNTSSSQPTTTSSTEPTETEEPVVKNQSNSQSTTGSGPGIPTDPYTCFCGGC